MNNKIIASIVIPVYNAEKTIQKSLLSCLKQKTKYNYEIIIVDDGSTDDTANIVCGFKNKKIKYLRINHSGISYALNYGIKNAKGNIILRMDADDEMYDDRVEFQINYMNNHTDIDVLCNNIDRYIFDETSNSFIEYSYAPNLELIKSNISIFDITDKKYNYNFICHPAVCFRKSLYDKVVFSDGFFYNRNYDGGEDYELWCRLIYNHYANITTHQKKVLKYYVKRNEEKSIIFNNVNIISKYYDVLLSEKTFGIYYICTGIYKNDFERFLLSVRNFFPNNKKKIILLSDGLDHYDKYTDDHNIIVEHHHIDDYPWPIVTLFKMKYMLMFKCDCDYIFYFNANSEILPINDYSWFDKDKLNLAYHKDYFSYNQNSCIFLEPYMDNPNSTSYMGTSDYTYVQGAFFGGPYTEVYKMCEQVNEMITIDLNNNIIPRYHDETYLNKYNYLHNNSYISNVLISQIKYNINDIKSFDPTQFIILHENIYKLDDNNKKDKYSNYIPHNLLQTLYNVNIYDYQLKYPEQNNRNNKKHKNIFALFIDNINNHKDIDYVINTIYNNVNQLIKLTNAEIIVYTDKQNKLLNDKLSNIISQNNIIKYDPGFILKIYNLNIKNCWNNYDNYVYLYKFNLLYTYLNEFNILDHDFSHIICLTLNFLLDTKFINTIKKIYNFNYIHNDVLFENVQKLDVNNFEHNDYVKVFNLFKFKYYFRYHFIGQFTNYFIISYDAIKSMREGKNQIKNEIFIYALPTTLISRDYNVGTIEYH